MDALLIFLLATVVSFIGSLQAGLVNTAVLATTLRSGKHAGRSLALGGAIPEFLYAGLAFAFGTWITMLSSDHPVALKWAAASTLFAMGIYFLFFFKLHLDRPGKVSGGIWKGLLIGLANPQLLLFWCGVKLSLHTFGITASGPDVLLGFALGAFAGALVLLLLLVHWGNRAKDRMHVKTLTWAFRLMGIALIVGGLFALR
ncbi:MAG: LysE family transporter [Flavobacteriales bacterium]